MYADYPRKMSYQPFRAFLSVWLIICMVFSMMPLGCSPAVGVRHAVGGAGQPYLPETTTEQLKDCSEWLQEGVAQGLHSVDARITVDESGRVLEATTTGEPNPDVGMCIRVALREMHVDKDIIDDAALRQTRPATPEVSRIPNRTHVGEIVTVTTITVVTIVYVEVYIELLWVALGITVTATVLGGAINAAEANAARARKPHQPNTKKWMDDGGSIEQKADGTTIYTRSDGVAVTYDKEGYPDFTPYRHPTVKDVQIEFTRDQKKDNKAADKAAGITEKMRTDEKYTWHHHEDGKTMQLIKRDVHEDFFHTGGMARARKEYGKCE